MRSLTRFLVTVLTSGSALALGLALLWFEARSVVSAGQAGRATDVRQLEEVALNSEVYARDGSLLAVLHAEENRSPVSLDRVPGHVVNAILDVEDEDFWSHGGLNLRSALRALAANLESGEVRQGGSTITQQLVKNALLTPEKRVDRKVKEAVLAVRLEDRLSKREILERYLNVVYFGNGAYGVQAAAETYFNTAVEKLSVGQAAFLAGILRNPVGYDPLKRPDLARARRDLALERMVANGHLSVQESQRVQRERVPFEVFTPLPPPNDYFVEEIKQRLLADERFGETAQERYNAVFRGGLKIYSTLDPSMQRQAESKRDEVLPTKTTDGRFTSALISLETSTGYVRAMVAGDDFAKAKYNLATQGRRQPGSSFKPYVLLAALEEGYSPNDMIDGTSPCSIKVPGFEAYTPGNYEGSAGGVMSLTDATARSVNCAYARLGITVGLEKVIDMAANLGLPRDRLEPYPSLSLGAEEVTALEMAAAYGAIANDGVYQAPRFYEKVLDRNGKAVLEGSEKGRRAMSSQTARMAVQVLKAVVEKGTGTRARLPGREVAGKTGTSQEHENAWFVGFTPQLSTAVWMGSPVGNVPMRNVGGIRVTGGSYPARIWAEFMAAALDDQPVRAFPQLDAKLVPESKFIDEKGGRADRRPRGDRRPPEDRRRRPLRPGPLQPTPLQPTPTTPLTEPTPSSTVVPPPG